MPTDFNDELQQQIRREADAYLAVQRFIAEGENQVNANRDSRDFDSFERQLRDSQVQQSAFSRKNDLANKLFQERIKESKSRTTSDSDLSAQLDHLERMSYYARPTRFSFYIEALSPTVNDRLIRNCITTSLPGRSLMTQGFKIYGNPLEQVYEVNYGTELNMTFRVGEDMLERDLFESWMNTAISYNTSDLNYPDDYMTTMKIYQLDRKDAYLYCIRLNNVFCKTIADIDFSSDSSDQVQTVQVSLSYSDFAVVGRTSVQGIRDLRFNSGLLPKSRAQLNRTTRNDELREAENTRINRAREVQRNTAIPDMWRYLNQY
jgi:hypothetical protein